MGIKLFGTAFLVIYVAYLNIYKYVHKYANSTTSYKEIKQYYKGFKEEREWEFLNFFRWFCLGRVLLSSRMLDLIMRFIFIKNSLTV